MLEKRILIFLCVAVAVSLRAAPYVINSAGSKVTGKAIRSESDGTVVLTTLNGQELRFIPGSYRQAVADPPPEITDVKALVSRGDLSGAAERLRQVKTDYRYLGWDRRAGLMLARVELAQNRFEQALKEYEELFAVQPKLKERPAERERYMQALLGAGRIEKVAGMIDEDIASGSREAAARAQIVRGDMKAADGHVEEALLDYLRTALLFEDQTEVQPEAIYKTAKALKERNDPRAKTWFQKLITEFPDSEFAQKVRGEME